MNRALPRILALLTVLALGTAACGGDSAEDTTSDAAGAASEAAGDVTDEVSEMESEMASEMESESEMASEMESESEMASEMESESEMASEMESESEMASEMESEMGSESESAAAGGAATDSAQACDAEAIVAAVEGGPEEGTLAGMTDEPVGTAASNNPVLTTLTAAATSAGLVDTLNSAEALTVFAPTDCAFAEFDPATLEAAMADPTGLLATVLGFHVVPGERLSAEQLATMTELETFTGATLPIAAEGDTISLNGGQATVVVPDIQTANATVHLIDAVMVPPEG